MLDSPEERAAEGQIPSALLRVDLPNAAAAYPRLHEIPGA
jgi:hypothetical protein